MDIKPRKEKVYYKFFNMRHRYIKIKKRKKRYKRKIYGKGRLANLLKGIKFFP